MQEEKEIKRASQEKGIKLVALVIMIVILIILAAVTINLAFGEGKIVKRGEIIPSELDIPEEWNLSKVTPVNFTPSYVYEVDLNDLI